MVPEGRPVAEFDTVFASDRFPVDGRMDLEMLKHYCAIFHKEGLAPPYPGGSYGNLSYRLHADADEFVITGSGIGLKDTLPDSAFALVHRVRTEMAGGIERHIAEVAGTCKPSTELLAHDEIYKMNKDIKAVFHCHCRVILEYAPHFGVPVTPRKEKNGTMALAKLIAETMRAHNSRLVIAAEHGLFVAGSRMEEAGELTLGLLYGCRGSEEAEAYH